MMRSSSVLCLVRESNKKDEQLRRCKRKRRLPRAQVRFAEFDNIVEIPNIGCYSREEVSACYFSSRELNNIQRECIDIVSQADENCRPGDGHWLRGLDQHTLKYKKTQDRFHRQVHEAVFQIQEFQQSSGVNTTEIMAELYAKYSAPSVAAAHMTAMSDLFSAFKGSYASREVPVIKDLPNETVLEINGTRSRNGNGGNNKSHACS